VALDDASLVRHVSRSQYLLKSAHCEQMKPSFTKIENVLDDVETCKTHLFCKNRLFIVLQPFLVLVIHSFAKIIET